MTSPKTKNDIDRIVLGELRTAEFPAPESMEAYRVHILPEVHEQILNHSRENLNIELCGVLVGEPFQDRKGAWLKIEAAIRGEHSSGESAQVTFTQETWAHIHREMDTKYPNLRIVGWYHTHPGFGIFLSSMDLFIQENFFNLPGQVAFVVDPRSGDEGFFCWKNGETKRMNHYWVGDKEKFHQPSAIASSGDLAQKVRHLEKQVSEQSGKLQVFWRHFEGRLTKLQWGGILFILLWTLCVAGAAIMLCSDPQIRVWFKKMTQSTESSSQQDAKSGTGDEGPGRTSGKTLKSEKAAELRDNQPIGTDDQSTSPSKKGAALTPLPKGKEPKQGSPPGKGGQGSGGKSGAAGTGNRSGPTQPI